MKKETRKKLKELEIGETLETNKWIYKREKSESGCKGCCFKKKSLDDYCFKVNCYKSIYTREVK